MAEWKDELIERHIAPIINMISKDVDPEFSRIDFISWFEAGVTSVSYRVYNKENQKVTIQLSDPMITRNKEIRHHAAELRAGFEAHDEAWVAMKVDVRSSGVFNIDFDYDDPYKFDFRRERK